MAIIHKATIRPTKPEVLAGLLGGPVTVLGAYRFDDPAGEVGVEGFVVRRDAQLRHVVLTYRAAPFDGGDAHLVSTMEHSVLGRRWIYDGTQDPVALACFRRALQGEQEQAVEEVWDGDERVAVREAATRVTLVGGPHPAGAGSLVIVGALDPGSEPAAGSWLRAAWDGGVAAVATLA
jgi:hypothetical protein